MHSKQHFNNKKIIILLKIVKPHSYEKIIYFTNKTKTKIYK